MIITRPWAAGLTFALLAGCTSNSKAPTSETWIEVSPQQAVAAGAPRIDVYAEQEGRIPQMGRNGCATSPIKSGDVMVIDRVHPREVYCISIAPLRVTTIELPAGTQLNGMSSGMMDFLSLVDADSGGRRVISVQAKCTPMRIDEKGQPIQAEIHKRNLMDQSSLPYCPRQTSDLVILTSDGPISTSLQFNSDGRTRVVDIRNNPQLTGTRPRIPIKTPEARDLYAMSVDDVVVPWVPDDAWWTGDQAVVIWHRPMPTLPGLHIGKEGEMLATPPVVINEGSAIAMVISPLVTEFQLRIDDRAIQFSGLPLTSAQKQQQGQERQPNTTVRM